MSTATIAAAPTVRPLSAIKADYVNHLAGKPESLIADAKAALTWLPRKAYNAAMRALRWLHVPQFLSFARRNFSKFLAVVGKGAFAVEMLTSPWGQKTIGTVIKTAGKVVEFTAKTAWKILTSPFRWFSPTRAAVERVEAAISKVNKKLTPNSGETFGPLQITRDIAAEVTSPKKTHMKLARTTALAVMAVRTTRWFVPAGWMRIAAYALDGLMVARAYDETLSDTWLGRRLSRQVAVIEADVKREGETVVAEASTLTREAAAQAAAKMRQEADEIAVQAQATAEAVLTETADAAQVAAAEVLVSAEDQAAELRHNADAIEETAERLATAQEDVPSPVLVAERPKPGPSVPPMGGVAPRTGPQQGQPHQRSGKPNKPQKH